MSMSLANADTQTSAAIMPWPGLWSGDDAARYASPSTIEVSQDCEIYGEGEPADSFFALTSGVVRSCKFLQDGRRQIDAFYAAGDIFGVEIGDDYTLSAEAVTDCTVVKLRRRGLDAGAASNAGVPRQLFTYAMKGFARAQEHALLLGRKSAMEKVCAFLIDCGRDAADAALISLPMCRNDIADYLGLTIETVSRMLSLLEREGVISLSSARRIALKDMPALVKYRC